MASLDLAELLARAERPEDELVLCGIYFLFCKSELVYIGQSVDIRSRVRAHFKDPQKQFDRYAYILCAAEHLNMKERELIFEFKPVLNKTIHRPMCGPFLPKHSPVVWPSPESFTGWDEYIDGCFAVSKAVVLTPDEAAHITRISRGDLVTMAKNDIIPAILLGRNWRFTKDSLHRLWWTLRLPFPPVNIAPGNVRA